MKYTRRKFITTLGAGSALLMLPAIPKLGLISKITNYGVKEVGVKE